MRFHIDSPDDHLKRSLERMREKYAEDEELPTFDRIVKSIEAISTVLEGRIPEIVIMNLDMFEEWFKWCQENDYDFTNVAGVEVILEKDSPAPLSYIIEKNTETLKQMEAKQK